MFRLVIQIDDDGELTFVRTTPDGDFLEAGSEAELGVLVRRFLGLKSEQDAIDFKEKVRSELDETKRMEIAMEEDARTQKLRIAFIEMITGFSSLQDFQNDITASFSVVGSQPKI